MKIIQFLNTTGTEKYSITALFLFTMHFLKHPKTHFRYYMILRWRHTIRNCIFWHQSLEISYFWLRIQDSRHFQLAIYTVFHEESESAVRIDQILHPEEKIKKNQPTRVSISYRKISYHMSPPYVSFT